MEMKQYDKRMTSYDEVETKRTMDHRCSVTVNFDESFVRNESMAVTSFNRPNSGSLSRKRRMSNECTVSIKRTMKDVYASYPTPVYA